MHLIRATLGLRSCAPTMTPIPAVTRPGQSRSPGSKSVAGRRNLLDVLPIELRLKIYDYFYADAISELSDNLFGVFWLYDSLYDYTSSYLESHVGKTGLTALLSTCKNIHGEALEALCNEAEIILNIMGDNDSNDEEREKVRFSKGNRLLEFAKNLKVNMEPLSDETNERFIGRLRRFSELINQGVNLRSLKIRMTTWNLSNPQSFEDILSALSTLRTAGNPIEVYLGEMDEDMLNKDSLNSFLSKINGIYMGHGHNTLEPHHYDGEE